MNSIDLAYGGRSAATESFGAWAVRELRANCLIYGLIAAFVLYTFVVAAMAGDSLLPFFYTYVHRGVRALVLLCCAGILAVAVRSLVQDEVESPLAYVRSYLFTPESRRTVAAFSFGCTTLAVFMGAFLYNKTMIPDFAPFSWDPVFAAWDRSLFFGRQPWEVLHPLIGYPAITIGIDFLYSAWVPLVFVVWSGLLISPRASRALRQRFWLATVLSWIIVGLGMATSLSSAGPCFVPMLFPGLAGEYAGLNAYLERVNDGFILTSALSKDYLWEIYASATGEPGGISAMPSMHNAQAVLFVLASYPVSRRLGHLMVAYAVVIFVGSVHLAWHYAVDGFVAAAAALAVWWIAGLLTRGRPRTAEA